MGCYVEVAHKQKWLEDNCKHSCALPVPWEDYEKDCLPVVLVDNGTFLAAGIAFDEDEYARFTRLDDYRPKCFFSVEIKKLKKVSDIENYLKGGTR